MNLRIHTYVESIATSYIKESEANVTLVSAIPSTKGQVRFLVTMPSELTKNIRFVVTMESEVRACAPGELR